MTNKVVVLQRMRDFDIQGIKYGGCGEMVLYFFDVILFDRKETFFPQNAI